MFTVLFCNWRPDNGMISHPHKNSTAFGRQRRRGLEWNSRAKGRRRPKIVRTRRTWKKKKMMVMMKRIFFLLNTML